MLHHDFAFSYDDFGNTKAIQVFQRGFDVFGNSYTSKGTAFTREERESLEVDGSVPPTVRTLDQQIMNSVRKVNAMESDIDQFVYLRGLFDRNATLAHAVIASDVARYMRIIYTPTVGLACQRYSSMFRQANGLHFYPGNIDKAESILRQFTAISGWRWSPTTRGSWASVTRGPAALPSVSAS